MAKGFTKDGKFRPITDYKKVSRKKREPFRVTKDGVKITQRELIQMQRADVGRRKKDDSFKIGDNVSYWGGIGKITYIRYDSKTQKPSQYKINGKFVQPDSIKTRKARDCNCTHPDLSHTDLGNCLLCGCHSGSICLSKEELKLLRKVPSGAKRSDSAEDITRRNIVDPRTELFKKLSRKYNFDPKRASINLETGEVTRNF